MTGPSTFDVWAETLSRDAAAEGADDPAIAPEWLAWLRDVYERQGAVPRRELLVLARAACVASAEAVFPTLIDEIERTTGHAAELRVQSAPADLDDETGLGLELMISGGGTSLYPVDWGPDRESALVGIADFTTEWVTEAIGWPWPTCPTDNYGLDPELSGGWAVWRCRSSRGEVVARIGDLGK